jgi:phosphate transport system substrate-binding protein
VKRKCWARSVAVSVFALSVAALLAACETPPSHTTVSQVSDGRSLTSLIAVDGSSTMISLVKVWTQEFKKSNPDIPFSITPNDSGGGIAALIKRTTDIALSSRDLTKEEEAAAHAQGVTLKRFTVARDAIAFIVNPANPVDSVKLDDIESVYTGKISNWKELGGKSAVINKYMREKNSGTFAYFHDHVMHGKDPAPSVKLIPSVGQTVDKIATDPNGVAFVGLHHATDASDKVKILGLRLMDTGKATKPSADSSIDAYPLSRPLLIFADENPKSSTKKFIDFCLSAEGQKLVSETGYIPIKN